MHYSLSLEDFARSFGTTPEALPEECRKVIEENDFSYTIPREAERDRIILDVLKKTDSDRQVIGAPERQEVWQKGWEENLKEFIAGGKKLETLVPRFIRAGQPIRFDGNFILPVNPLFELAFLRVFRIWLFKTYFSALDPIYEFGCGTGFNLVELAQMYPGKTYVGLDFVPALRLPDRGDRQSLRLEHDGADLRLQESRHHALSPGQQRHFHFRRP